MSDMGKKVARNSILASWVRMYMRLAWPTFQNAPYSDKPVYL